MAVPLIPFRFIQELGAKYQIDFFNRANSGLQISKDAEALIHTEGHQVSHQRRQHSSGIRRFMITVSAL